jgi:hypothetical protein
LIEPRIARRAARAWIELTKGLKTSDSDTPEYAWLWTAEARLYDWLIALPEDIKEDLRERFNVQI